MTWNLCLWIGVMERAGEEDTFECLYWHWLVNCSSSFSIAPSFPSDVWLSEKRTFIIIITEFITWWRGPSRSDSAGCYLPWLLLFHSHNTTIQFRTTTTTNKKCLIHFFFFFSNYAPRLDRKEMVCPPFFPLYTCPSPVQSLLFSLSLSLSHLYSFIDFVVSRHSNAKYNLIDSLPLCEWWESADVFPFLFFFFYHFLFCLLRLLAFGKKKTRKRERPETVKKNKNGNE